MILLATAVSGALFALFLAFAAIATWGHWGHAELTLEAIGCIVSGGVCGLGGAVLCSDSLRAAAMRGLAVQVAAALLADPFLRDRVVRQLAYALLATGRTPDLRKGKTTKPFEVRPVWLVRP